MKTLIKLLIAAAIINATVRAASAAWTYYQFKDAAEQTVIFGYGATTGQLHEQIMRRAVELQVPLEPQNLQVTRDGPRTLAEASYRQPVELFPRYTYVVPFSFTVDALAVNPTTAEDAIRP
jgi:hypothetical protein